MTQEHSEGQARRAAKRVGLMARKSRWRAGSINNLGDFQIIDPMRNWILAGEKFDYTADDVVEFCAGVRTITSAAGLKAVGHVRSGLFTASLGG